MRYICEVMLYSEDGMRLFLKVILIFVIVNFGNEILLVLFFILSIVVSKD